MTYTLPFMHLRRLPHRHHYIICSHILPFYVVLLAVFDSPRWPIRVDLIVCLLAFGRARFLSLLLGHFSTAHANAEPTGTTHDDVMRDRQLRPLQITVDVLIQQTFAPRMLHEASTDILVANEFSSGLWSFAYQPRQAFLTTYATLLLHNRFCFLPLFRLFLFKLL